MELLEDSKARSLALNIAKRYARILGEGEVFGVEAGFAYQDALKTYQLNEENFEDYASKCINEHLFTFATERIEKSPRTRRKNSEGHLSPMEHKVLGLHADGKTYRQISEDLTMSMKAVDNAMQRVRRKITEEPEFLANAIAAIAQTK